MSFRATIPFPNCTLSRADIEEFFSMFPGGGIVNILFVPVGIVELLLHAADAVGGFTGVGPRLQAFVVWITNIVNRHLSDLGYFSHIPRPGPQVPRPDVLPAIAPFGYGIGGRRSDHWAENDGIVNTASMDGPDGNVRDINDFLPLLDPGNLAPVHGPFWHLGVNTTIDHADQLGVFTDDTTVSGFLFQLVAMVLRVLIMADTEQNGEVEVMYKLLAELVGRIP